MNLLIKKLLKNGLRLVEIREYQVVKIILFLLEHFQIFIPIITFIVKTKFSIFSIFLKLFIFYILRNVILNIYYSNLISIIKFFYLKKYTVFIE